MKKTIFLYGLALAVLVSLLKAAEYRYFVRDFSLEFYGGVMAVLFTTLGIWAGFRLTQRKKTAVGGDFVLNETGIRELGISPRELEVLGLISGGLSNQEIADKLFVSLNTIKTHTSSLFVKLDVKRRTQAIQKAKELKLIR